MIRHVHRALSCALALLVLLMPVLGLAGLPAAVDLVATCNGTGDDRATIQAEIDACQARGVANGNVFQTLVFPAGVCRVSNSVIIKSCRIQAANATGTSSTAIVWDGPAGGSPFVKDASVPGGFTYGEIGGFQFSSGAHEFGDGVLFDSPGTVYDAQFNTHHLACVGGTGSCVKIKANALNVSLHNLRADGMGECMVNIENANGAYLGRVLVSEFTADFQNQPGQSIRTPKGVVCFNDRAVSSGNNGTLVFEHGRIEMGNANTTAGFGVIRHETLASGVGGKINPQLRNITYQDNEGNSPNDYLLYTVTTGGNDNEGLSLDNVSIDGLSNIYGGNTSMHELARIPPNGVIYKAAYGFNLYPDQIGFSHIALRAFAANTGAVSFYLKNEQNPRMQFAPTQVQFLGNNGAIGAASRQPSGAFCYWENFIWYKMAGAGSCP